MKSKHTTEKLNDSESNINSGHKAPNGKQRSKDSYIDSSRNEVDLKELWDVIWQRKWIIITATFCFSVASVFYSVSLPNTYKSEALLAPVADQKGIGLSGQIGGLAALAGLNVGGASVDKTALAIEVVKSRDFLSQFIEKRIKLQDLMAVEAWNMEDNSIIYNNEVYDFNKEQWVRAPKPPKKKKPSKQESYKKFLEILRVSQDVSTGMVKLSIEHVSPYIAQQWVTMLVEDLNHEMKLREIEEAERSIEYLQKQINTTSINDLRSSLFSLIEEQTRTLMLANVRDEYVFKMIDTPVIPEEKSSPKRALIVLLITFVGCFLTVTLVLVVTMFNRKAKVISNA